MRHGIFSEAITRFTKGQPAELAAPVLSAAIHLVEEWSDAKITSQIVEAYPGKLEEIALEFTTSTINDALGSTFTDKDIINTLQNVEFTAEQIEPETIRVSAPYWRADIHIVEDIIEEIGRLNGFDSIKPTLPTRDFTAVRPDSFDDFRRNVRKILVRAGSNEMLTYSFIHGNVMQKAGQNPDNSYRITNSISPELQYYRQTLTPSLLELVHPNIKMGYDNFALFEMNKSHQKSDGMTDEDVPVEIDAIGLIIANKNKSVGAPYYQAKRLFSYLCESLGVELVFKVIDKELDDPLGVPFEYRRSAQIMDKKTGSLIGIMGEYKRSVARSFKLPNHAAGFEINTSALFESTLTRSSGYSPLSRYPASERDICFQVETKVLYSQIISALDSALNDVKLETNLTPIDIYQSDNATTKNITIRVRLTAHDHTLTGDEVTVVINSLIASVVTQTNAIII
jgi:phenylalanyl-tRNA synthetase beta chain